MRPPLPPFTQSTALEKVQAAEDGWNSRDPIKVSMAYSEDTRWRNRAEFINGRDSVQVFLTLKWQKELDYKLKKQLWSYTGSRIAVTFEYEWRDIENNWTRSYGNELWEFNAEGLMVRRIASINDLSIEASARQL